MTAIMARRRSTRLASVVMVGALGASLTLTACGGGGSKSASKNNNGGSQVQTSGGSPSSQVDSAVNKLGSNNSLEVALSLPISASDLQQMSGSGSQVTPAEAQAIAGGSIFIIVGAGHGDLSSSRTDPNDALDFGVTISGNTPFEIRYVDQNLYVHVQINQMLTDVGQDPSKASQITGEAGQLNTYVPGLSSLIQGSWVELSHGSLQSLEGPLKGIENEFASKGSSSSSVPSSTPSLSQELKLYSIIINAVKANSTITSLGSSGGRSEYSVTVQVANLLTAVAPQIESAFASVPKEGADLQTQIQKAEASIPPGQTATADVYVANGSLSEVDIDLNQFTHKYSFPIPLHINLSSPGAPTAPSGATQLDTSKLPSLLGSGGL